MICKKIIPIYYFNFYYYKKQHCIKVNYKLLNSVKLSNFVNFEVAASVGTPRTDKILSDNFISRLFYTSFFLTIRLITMCS